VAVTTPVATARAATAETQTRIPIMCTSSLR
jgi:hypothetical protein